MQAPQRTSRLSVTIRRERARRLGIIIRHSPALAARVMRGEITAERALRQIAGHHEGRQETQRSRAKGG
jgi:hypothetical protein